LQAFKNEMRQALLLSLFMFVFAVVMLSFLTGRVPWRLADPELQEAAPAAATEGPPKSNEYEF